MLENIPSPENISKDTVIAAFQEKGVSDPEAQALYTKWYDQELEKVERANTPELLILFNSSLADIYEAIGDYVEAYNVLDGILDAVTSLGDLDLYNDIMTRLESLNGKIED